MNKKDFNILILGLGYVGLPLCVELYKNKFSVSGFDINKKHIDDLKQLIDFKSLLKKDDLKYLKNISFSSKIGEFSRSNIFIITVPTPIYSNKKPNFTYIYRSLEEIAKVLKKNDTIILESTVYPGFSEDIIYPYFKEKLNFKVNNDYFFGYSPERINPADKKYSLSNINKIISSENKSTLKAMEYIYKKVVHSANIHITNSVKVAEAAKVIENTQRDLNISFMNEISIIFNHLNIDTKEVLDAASTKWNFHRYTPGRVGGHCIGVDPYYLSYKSKLVGYKPNVILSGRKVNDNLPNRIIKILKEKIKLKKTKTIENILFLGITFKENCNDTRNSGAIKLLKKVIRAFPNSKIDIYDNLADDRTLVNASNNSFQSLSKIKKTNYQIIIIAVCHDKIRENLKSILNHNKKSLILDLKSNLPKENSDFRL